MTEAETDLVDVVRRGYDALSLRYRADDASPGRYGPWIAELLAVLKGASRVLDLGCGCGVPVARDLVAAGHRVTGDQVAGNRDAKTVLSSRIRPHYFYF